MFNPNAVLPMMLIAWAVIGLLGMAGFWSICSLKDNWRGWKLGMLFFGTVFLTLAVQVLATFKLLGLSWDQVSPYL